MPRTTVSYSPIPKSLSSALLSIHGSLSATSRSRLVYTFSLPTEQSEGEGKRAIRELVYLPLSLFSSLTPRGLAISNGVGQRTRGFARYSGERLPVVAERMWRYRGAFELAEVLLSKEEEEGY